VESAGLLLLTGGHGHRFGGPKHDRAHPLGGTWGGHLVGVFREVFPEGPVQLLGQPLPDRPELPMAEDPGQGPARALALWAAAPIARPFRWWVAPCDQVRWTAGDLRAWHAAATAADPRGTRWVLARNGDHVQYLGGFLGGGRVPELAGLAAPSLRELAAALQATVLDWPGAVWEDVDTPEAFRAWVAGDGLPP
jgi:hypothetical protein